MDEQPRAFGISTYSYQQSRTARDTMEHLALRGYAEFELMAFPGHLWPDEMDGRARSGLARFVEEAKLRVVTLSIANNDLNVASAYPGVREHSLAVLRSIVGLAGDPRVPGVVIGTGKANPLFPLPDEKLRAHFFAALDTLCPLAERAGTSIYLENMPVSFLPGTAALAQALDEYGNERVGFVYDVANGHYIGEDIAQALRIVAGRLKRLHVSDTGQQVYRHDPVGLGDIDFAAIPPVLAEIGHTATPILEVISRRADRDIDDSVARLRRLRWGATSASAASLPA